MRTAAVLVLSGSVALAQAPATNYDEAKVPPHTLPPLLVMSGGAPVRGAADWETRRTEIRALLESQMFGRAPARPDGLAFAVTDVDRAALGGKAVRKHVSITARGKTFGLLLYLPAAAARPVPVFVGLGFSPNQSVSTDPGIRPAGTWIQHKGSSAIELQPARESSRGSAASRWQVDAILARGFGLATMYYGDIEPDIAGAMTLGIRGTYLKPGQEAPGAGDWGAIAAWAWGLSRVVDYLETDRDVDARRLAVVGHSRLGKAALWAGAADTRFAMVISNDSGEGGAAISRRGYGETVADLNTRFPHWFCADYKKYSGREAEMPFDAHMLLALAAPRPLYVASAEEDRWADPRGEFLAAVAASEVYELLGRKGLATKTMPPVNQPVGETVRYHVRTGTHDITAYDWQQYLDFAERHFGPAIAATPRAQPSRVESRLEILTVATGAREVVWSAQAHFEAPNWSRDGQSLLFNQGGRIYVLPLADRTPRLLDTGTAIRCNNDHGLSPDGKWLAISHTPDKESLIYVAATAGGEPRLVTPKGPSYWHGWSPDGRTLAYCARRDGEYDVYTIPVEGGDERRLTTSPGLDDGPDYAPDGRIWFNSVRTGVMKIWRMDPDGTNQTQMTRNEEYADWFPHPSPDGKQVVFLSYDRAVEGHPANKDVVLRLMPAGGGAPRVVARLFGGQGTINVPSWSPDGRRVAFVSYRLLPE
jgi:Tol biopolymer transport system component